MSRWLRFRLVLDRVVAGVLLVLAVPLIVVLAFLVRRHDGGPAFLTVPRVGRGGHRFGMWKIRSMRADTADGRAAGVALTAAHDDRITPIGRRMRALHLDELPQLWNVVRGEMALLGPRPEAPEFVDVDDAAWAEVLTVPPAIAGPTQLVVGRWETRVITAAPDGSAYRDLVVPVKLAVDAWYARTTGPAFDLFVLWTLLRRFANRAPDALIARVTVHVPQAAAVVETEEAVRAAEAAAKREARVAGSSGDAAIEVRAAEAAAKREAAASASQTAAAASVSPEVGVAVEAESAPVGVGTFDPHVDVLEDLEDPTAEDYSPVAGPITSAAS